MRHLIVSREYPPAPYAPGGIGSYVLNIARLLVGRGETVHIIGQRWKGAPLEREVACDGRLIVHRIAIDEPPADDGRGDARRLKRELDGLKLSDFPNQWFAWHAAILAEQLIEAEAIDVVEGQDWEAPLYFLLLRRALGLGPPRQPPVIVHLHCPSELSRRYNGAIHTPLEYPLMQRMEGYCIKTADSLLCPSHYLAKQCCDVFDLAAERIQVIHLPVGFEPPLERDPEVWAEGSICYVGRIEPRKGVIEWIRAASRVAQEDPKARFDFVGADIWGLQKELWRRLPASLHPRFRFHGSQPRHELPRFLAQARAAVVPSRWENFPYVCVEAMSSGLPVIATRLGGMVEMVEDGHSGWLAPDDGVAGMVDGLSEALRRCLAASPEQRQAMGVAAARAIRETCDNARMVDAQLAYRQALAGAGARRSLDLATGPDRPGAANLEPTVSAAPTRRQGAGVVVSVAAMADGEAVVESLLAQSQAPRSLVFICQQPAGHEDAAMLARIGELGGEVTVHPCRAGAGAWNHGWAGAGHRDGPAFWLFLDQDDYLLPDCLEQLDMVMAQQPQVGVISFWTFAVDGTGRIVAAPCPDLPFQLAENDAVSASAFRTEALDGGGLFSPGLPRGYDTWDLVNKAMAKGWTAVTYPGILARRDRSPELIPWPDGTALRAARMQVLQHFPEASEPNTLNLIDHYLPIPQLGPRPTPLAKIWLRRLAKSLINPRRASQAVARKSRRYRAWRATRMQPRGSIR